MIDIEYANAYSEVLEILKYIPIKDYNKIPKNKIELFEKNANDEHGFIYNPNNSFLRKVNALVDYNITDILADKYRLLNVDITNELIRSETIDSTLQDVQYINLIQNIERSKIDLPTIKILCRMKSIIESENNE